MEGLRGFGLKQRPEFVVVLSSYRPGYTCSVPPNPVLIIRAIVLSYLSKEGIQLIHGDGSDIPG